MDRDKGKGKAIANESDDESPRESVRNQGVRASGSVTREINLGSPRLNYDYNFGVDPSHRWVMDGGRFMRESDYPPLAHSVVFGSQQNNNTRWVRVGFPTYQDISWIVPRTFVNYNGEGTSAQGEAMFRGSITWATHMPVPRHPVITRPPIIISPFGQTYVLTVQPGIFFYGPPNLRPIPQNYLNNSCEGTSTQGAMGNGASNNRKTIPSSVPSTSSLNPYAQEWRMPSTPSFNPYSREWREEDCSLFITFSHGQPLTPKQIFWFLSMTFGITNLLEVDIHQPRQGPAHFGRLVFTTPAIPMMILNGQAEVRIYIYNKSVICKKYIPREHRTTR